MRSKKSRKATRSGSNTFMNQILGLFTINPFAAFNFRQVAGQLGITDKPSRELVKMILDELLESGELVEAKRGKYKLNPLHVKQRVPRNVISGRVDMKQTGKAYIISDETAEDVYIAPNNTNHALNGDKVKVMLFPQRKGRKLEGQITEVIERARQQFVGVIQLSGRFAFLIPDDPAMTTDIIIPAAQLNQAKNGDKVIARITEWPEASKNPFGEVVQVLGKPGEHEVEMKSILASFNFPLAFPKAVEKEAGEIPEQITDAEISRRRDFRGVFTCTIDPDDAKDFDDALSLQKLDNGNWEVGVHIADVSHYVRPGSLIDKEAYLRGTSVYLVDRTIPMLPEKLSNHVCSLWPDADKLCYSTVFEMNEKAEILSEWFGRAVIHSDRRFTYEEVQEMIEGKDGDYKSEIMVLHGLATKLREERFRKGSINFTSREVKFRLDEKLRPIEAFIKEQKESNRLIEDFMLLANKHVAERIGKKRGQEAVKTFVYRIHDKPNEEKLNVFAEFVRKLGYSLKTTSRKALSGSLNSLFQQIAGKGEENLIENIAIRTMAKAVYSTKNIGHYGLAFPFYTHFTSPIRRYPDLMVHRLLDDYLRGKPSASQPEYEEKCKYASDMERNAVEAERASVKYKQAEFMLDKIGQRFTGQISGVSKWGIFVEVDINKGEGMVPIRSLRNDFYYLDEDNFKVVGHHYHKEYRLGDPVEIIVKHIDLPKKQMEFEMIE